LTRPNIKIGVHPGILGFSRRRFNCCDCAICGSLSLLEQNTLPYLGKSLECLLLAMIHSTMLLFEHLKIQQIFRIKLGLKYGQRVFAFFPLEHNTSKT
jgi:hypothetical protein